MTITESTRHDMINALEGAIGRDPAMTLAEHLPPVGWADVATKADLAHLSEHMDLRFAATQADLTQLSEHMDFRFAATQADLTQLSEHMDFRFAATQADLTQLSEHMDFRFAEVDRRFEAVDLRFEEIDRRFEEIDRRFEQMDRRFDQMDGRIDGLVEEIGLRIDAAIGQKFGPLLKVHYLAVVTTLATVLAMATGLIG